MALCVCLYVLRVPFLELTAKQKEPWSFRGSEPFSWRVPSSPGLEASKAPCFARPWRTFLVSRDLFLFLHVHEPTLSLWTDFPNGRHTNNLGLSYAAISAHCHFFSGTSPPDCYFCHSFQGPPHPTKKTNKHTGFPLKPPNRIAPKKDAHLEAPSGRLGGLIGI